VQQPSQRLARLRRAAESDALLEVVEKLLKITLSLP